MLYNYGDVSLPPVEPPPPRLVWRTVGKQAHLVLTDHPEPGDVPFTASGLTGKP